MEELNIHFQYSFSSYIGIMEGTRYIQEIFVTIVNTDESGFKEEIIGRSTLNIILLEQALNDEYNIEEIFDMSEYTYRIGSKIFNFRQGELKNDIQKYFDFNIIHSNICIMERLGIKPEYRGKGIARKLIKDIVHNWGSTCGLFVMQLFPLQGEPAGYRHNELGIDLELEKMEPDMKKATKQLTAYYKSTGFVTIPGYKGLLFYTSAFSNEKMDAISLEEFDEED